MNPPDIKKNPSPKQRYELTMVIKDAPGIFDSIKGYMGYEISNKECIAEDPLDGTHNAPSEAPNFTFSKVSDGIYKGYIYLDYLSDENYYGVDICHWHLTSSYAMLKINGVVISPYIFRDQILSSSSNITYFSKNSYFDRKSVNRYDSGIAKKFLDQVEEKPSEYFSIEISSKSASQ